MRIHIPITDSRKSRCKSEKTLRKREKEKAKDQNCKKRSQSNPIFRRQIIIICKLKQEVEKWFVQEGEH
jgi:hypothetical protein